MKYILNKKNKKGFTLVEMLVAVFIFSLALAGLMTISSRGLKSARFAQKQVVADYLALEAVEIIRNQRDAAFLRGSNTNTWLSVFNTDGCLGALNGNTNDRCVFELSGSNAILYPCSLGNCNLYYNPSVGRYEHFQNGPPTGYINTEYTREIFLEQTSNSDEMVVTVDISWPTGSTQYVQNLFLWR